MNAVVLKPASVRLGSTVCWRSCHEGITGEVVLALATVRLLC